MMSIYNFHVPTEVPTFKTKIKNVFILGTREKAQHLKYKPQQTRNCHGEYPDFDFPFKMLQEIIKIVANSPN